MAKRDVLVELRVPSNLPATTVLSLAASEIKVAGFELDATYRPVPITPQDEQQASSTSPNQEHVIVRGTLEEGQEVVLEREPMVVAVWSDAHIEPFDKQTAAGDKQIRISPEDLAF